MPALGQSVKYQIVINPKTTAGIPSMMNNHRQPLIPSHESPSSTPARGEPIT